MTRLPTFKIIQADVREGLKQIPDNSVDVICSSPPYWRQREYKSEGQIGQEKTSEEFVNTIVDIFYNHCYRVLKPHGLIFLNLGDSMNGSGGAGYQGGNSAMPYKEYGALVKKDARYKERDLLNIPNRVYAGLRDSGYYWRSTVIWEKSNGPMESVMGVRWERHRIKVRDIPVKETKYKKKKIKGQNSSVGNHHDVEWENCPGCDKCNPSGGYVLRWGSGRPTNKYEFIGILTKRDYYWDTEAVRTPYAESSVERRQYPLGSFGDSDGGNGNKLTKEVNRDGLDYSYTGANIGNIWRMPTAMSAEKHFAQFPEQLPEICIKAGSSEYGCCSECGKPYARILERVVNDYRTERYADGSGYDDRRKPNDIFAQATSSTIKTIGWKATCSCKVYRLRADLNSEQVEMIVRRLQ